MVYASFHPSRLGEASCFLLLGSFNVDVRRLMPASVGSSAMFLTSYSFRRAQPATQATPTSALPWEFGMQSREATRVSSSPVCLCLTQRASFVLQQLQQQSMSRPLRTACDLLLCSVRGPSTLRFLTLMQSKRGAIARGALLPPLWYMLCPKLT